MGLCLYLNSVNVDVKSILCSKEKGEIHQLQRLHEWCWYNNRKACHGRHQRETVGKCHDDGYHDED